MRPRNFPDRAIYCLFTAYCKADQAAHSVLNEVGDDMTHVRYVEAEAQSTKILQDFLHRPTSSLYGILLKLKLACQYGDFMMDALDPSCRLVAPRAVVAAIHDLEALVLNGNDNSGVPDIPPAIPNDGDCHET